MMKKRGRPTKIRSEPDAIDVAYSNVKSPEGVGTTNKLPTDPNELEKAIAPFRTMARPCVGVVNGVVKGLGAEPLDKQEVDGGIDAFSMAIYQAGGFLDARIMLTLWFCGIALPRVLKKLEEQEQNAKSETARPVESRT